MRAYATSDLHADFQANRALVETLSETNTWKTCSWWLATSAIGWN